jgi:hypothetical protein
VCGLLYELLARSFFAEAVSTGQVPLHAAPSQDVPPYQITHNNIPPNPTVDMPENGHFIGERKHNNTQLPLSATNLNPYIPQASSHSSEMDAHYWRSMLVNLGFDGSPLNGFDNASDFAYSDMRNQPQYMNQLPTNFGR